MNLRHTTRDIHSQVEQLTGCPVEVIEDRSLSTTATVDMASRRTLPAHLVRYSPTAAQPADYAIRFRNRSGPTYTMLTLPGEYSAPAVMAIMYGAFQQFALKQDLGIELAREYEAAVQMKG